MATLPMTAHPYDDVVSNEARTELLDWVRQNLDASEEADQRIKTGVYTSREKYGKDAFAGFTKDNATERLDSVSRLRDGSLGVMFQDGVTNTLMAFKLPEAVPLPERLERCFTAA
ncbi:hypothetical protein [Streptomyces mirabilis]|uniref:hypothetical protein n=1 Tax=Streptomyces mirabilis TaxID=68239 RepID=UPI0037F196EC